MSDFWSDPSSTSILHVCEHPRLWRDCAGSPEPSLVANVISTIISWAGSFYWLSCIILNLSKSMTNVNNVWEKQHSFSYGLKSHMSRDVTKPTNWHVRPVKTQISLCIRPVWSESLLCTQWVGKGPSFHHADREDSESLLGAQAILLVLSWCGSYCKST